MFSIGRRSRQRPGCSQFNGIAGRERDLRYEGILDFVDPVSPMFTAIVTYGMEDKMAGPRA
ncbi:MAG TPA: hypothetical protein PK653_04765, partial [Syntrophales bacterium]|nr:hypothetical protein [Syntrophales bacterium]